MILYLQTSFFEPSLEVQQLEHLIPVVDLTLVTNEYIFNQLLGFRVWMIHL